MSLKLFLLVAVLTVAATQAAQPRFRGGVSTGGKACRKFNPPAQLRYLTVNMDCFEKNCKGVAACEWSDGMCGALPTPQPTPPPPPPTPTVIQCKLANAGPGATSADAAALCHASNCKYYVKASTHFRCCYQDGQDKISSCNAPPAGKQFPEPDPKMPPASPACTEGCTCCSNAKTIDEDMNKSELGGGKCKVGAGNKCKHTDDGKPCPSQTAVGTKCKPLPTC